MRAINKIVVHCSASPDALDVGFVEIDDWHEKRGWKSVSGIHCGYHFIIRKNGVVEVGRPVNEIGAHVEGANSDSIGVCLVGTHEFAPAQITSLQRIVKSLIDQFPKAKLYEHREFDSAKIQGKTCPNYDVHKLFGF